jgi:hypothetical protein
MSLQFRLAIHKLITLRNQLLCGIFQLGFQFLIYQFPLAELLEGLFLADLNFISALEENCTLKIKSSKVKLVNSLVSDKLLNAIVILDLNQTQHFQQLRNGVIDLNHLIDNGLCRTKVTD